MSMLSFSNQFKCCAVCSNWGGKRIPKGKYHVDVQNEDGMCYAVFPQGVPRSPQSSCPNFSLWSAIK